MKKTPKPKPGNLRRRTWSRFLRGPDPMLLDELYVPALREGLRYDRCCSYFSSSVLAAAARGFAGLIERLLALGEQAPRPAVRLVVNEELAAEDVRAMVETGDTSALEEALKRRFKDPKDALEKQRLAMLGWLVKAGLLEVRVGVMRFGEGVVHAKFGIITDERGNAVVFSGSGNESAAGLQANYERLEVSGSWADPERYDEYRREFEQLWTDTHPDVHTVSLPEALRLRLIKFAPPEPPTVEPSNALARQKAAMLWQFIAEAPYLAGDPGAATCDATALVDLWPHQRRVVEEVCAAWPEGRLLCDEVGMGKTIEAILVLRRLLAGRGVRRALLLVPAGLTQQWQGELREKGGLIVPRLEGVDTLVWPGNRKQRVGGLAQALQQDLLLMSRETARTESNRPILLGAEPWDLVLLDEAHAARRAKQEEGEFNTGTLLLDLLRQLQLRGKARGFLFLSATPMQTHPWEPWDLLSVLGEGGQWLAEFRLVREYYSALAKIERALCDPPSARRAATLICSDTDFPPFPLSGRRASDPDALARQIAFPQPGQKEVLARWLRNGSPLARRMHRNTRGTLRGYHQRGLLPAPPPTRRVQDVQYDFADPGEREVYEAITGYIDRRFKDLEREKRGKGFVMTVYRRRAASSPYALQRSLERRRDALKRIAESRAYDADLSPTDAPERLDEEDLPETPERGKISAALPTDPKDAQAELQQIEPLYQQLLDLSGRDTKRDRFFEVLRTITGEGRTALVFTEYTDTQLYLREQLEQHYGEALACYNGSGGQAFEKGQWKEVTKDAITERLNSGKLRVLVCTDAASEGLNLQAASAVINYDLPWNPSRVEQRIGRIDRIGQKHAEILVVNLFLANSVDERVYSLLRQRCGLFEHFVGPMQPVLARARYMLLHQEPFDDSVLHSTAAEAEQNPVAAHVYLEADPEELQQRVPAVITADMVQALEELPSDFGFKARKKSSGQIYELTGVGRRPVRFGAQIGALERDPELRPISPLDPVFRKLGEILRNPGERLPLVIASVHEGPFRASAALWLYGDGTSVPVDSVSGLRALCGSWDGLYPDPEAHLRTQAQARQQAEERVKQMKEEAARREAAMRKRQVEAARARLLRELGRYLLCTDSKAADLNQVLYAQINRQTPGAERLRRCLQRLGGYPDWGPLLQELQEFVSNLPENKRKARLLGSELEAALGDPRWIAAS